MPQVLIRASALAFAFDALSPLFDDATFHLPPGWTGLVGANGSGKSTLLRLLLRELRPTAGTLVREPADQTVHLCPQEVGQLTPAIEALAEATDGTSRRLLGQLALEPWRLQDWATLSPGERKRWQLGAALAAQPDVLLLDEPTNHLDVQGRQLVQGALQRFRGVGVLVSHDRVLLDALTTQTLRLHRGTARPWPGPWSRAKPLWEQERAAQDAARSDAVHRAEKLSASLDALRREHAAASANRNTGRRMKSRHDSDARTLAASTRAEWAATSIARSLASTRHAAEAATREVPAYEVDKTVGRSIFVDYQRAPKPQLAALELTELTAGFKTLTGPLSLVVNREDRIHLSGPNGAGKSTLLAALLDHARLPPERVLWLPQELTEAEIMADLEMVAGLDPQARGRTLSLVAALGMDPEQLRQTSRPSPGEARKLRLALGLGRHAWLLAMDEPTNHLDLPTVERLEQALAGFPGAILLVTHDPDLARSCTLTRWQLEDGQLEIGDTR